jgi:hypothetical protein
MNFYKSFATVLITFAILFFNITPALADDKITTTKQESCSSDMIKMVVPEKINLISDENQIPISVENKCNKNVNINIVAYSDSNNVKYENSSNREIIKNDTSIIFINATVIKNGKSTVFFTISSELSNYSQTNQVTIFTATQIGKIGTFGVYLMFTVLIGGGAFRTYKKHKIKASKK